jgi:uncharacterized protein YbjT (DUF2867 family)
MPDTTGPTDPRSRPSILVTGATGNLGREVVNRLVERDVRVRCLVRDRPEPRPGVDWMVGDLTDPADVRAALTGMDAVFLILPRLDSAPAREVVTEITAAAPRVVYLSSTAIDDRARLQSDPIVQVHADMEALLNDAGLRPIVLRSDTLASNARGWAAQLRRGDEVSSPDVARTAVVDERDVADAVVTVLLASPDRLAHEPYLLTGPEALTRAEQVARLGAALHRQLHFRALPAGLARSRMLADGRPAPLVEALITASVQRPESIRITDHLEHLIGVERPEASMPSAVGWVEAFPKRMVLQPKERQTVRLLARPPAGLRDGEYWARLVVTARAGSVPVTGVDDSSGITVGLNLEVRTVLPLQYRKGPVATSVRASSLKADVKGDSLAVRLSLVRQGTAAFIGTVRGALADSTGRTVAAFSSPVAVYYEVEPRFAAALPGGRLPQGRYRLRVEVTTEREDLPPETLLAARPVRDSLELNLP